MSRELESILPWVFDVLDGNARLIEARPLRGDRGPWFLRMERDDGILETVLKVASAESRSEIATEWAALTLAEKHDIPAPRPLAVDVDGSAGTPALLTSALPGTSEIPTEIPGRRLRALGAAAAEFHRIPLVPRPELPLRLRHMPWIDLALERRWAGRYQLASDSKKQSVLEEFLAEHPGWDPDGAREVLATTSSTPLLNAADARLCELAVPQGGEVFVHGDLWQGNTMWEGETYVGTIDWEAAGAGHYGVDLGALRLDAAILFNLSAADEVLAGWEEATGSRAEAVAYWDVVACLNTAADMKGFLPTIHQAGRTDIDAGMLTERRDAFLLDALERLDLDDSL